MKVLRAFLVGFSHSTGSANLYFSTTEFPSNKWIRDEAVKKFNCKNVVVLSIYEFASIDDFDKFSAE